MDFVFLHTRNTSPLYKKYLSAGCKVLSAYTNPRLLANIMIPSRIPPIVVRIRSYYTNVAEQAKLVLHAKKSRTVRYEYEY